jgi:putative peptide zinc metalloprotease protein
MSAADVLRARPRLRSDVLVSRPLLRGPGNVHLLLDTRTGTQLEVAPKVHFVIDRLDGRHSLEEIGTAYAVAFGARLGEPQWQQLLGLLYGRRLLVGTDPEPDPEPGPEPEPAAAADGPTGALTHPSATVAAKAAKAARAARAARAAKAPNEARTVRQRLLDGRLPLVADTPAVIERLHRATGFVRNRFLLGAVLLLVTAMTVDLAVHLRSLTAGTAALRHRPLTLLAVVAAVWLSMALHELAHGLAGRAAGGAVGEIGLRWRLPMAYLYCTVEDVRFLAGRGRQLAVAGAGVLMNLALLLPPYLLWTVLGHGARPHPGLDALLLTGAVAGLANLLPLPPLDGYKMLEYLLGTAQLSAESRRFTALALGALLRRGAGIGGYPLRSRLVLGGYAVAWAGLTAALLWALGLLLRLWLPEDVALFLPALLLGCVALLQARRPGSDAGGAR